MALRILNNQLTYNYLKIKKTVCCRVVYGKKKGVNVLFTVENCNCWPSL